MEAGGVNTELNNEGRESVDEFGSCDLDISFAGEALADACQ